MYYSTRSFFFGYIFCFPPFLYPLSFLACDHFWSSDGFATVIICNDNIVSSFSNNRIGLLATQKLALGIASHPNLKVLKVRRIFSFFK